MQMATKFSLGRLVATPGALEAIEASGQTPDFFIERHANCNWGEANEEDGELNEQALVNGERLLSAYRTLRGEKLWVITEADRSLTTILLASAYCQRRPHEAQAYRGAGGSLQE